MAERMLPNWPRGLSRFGAAAYIGASHAMWDRMVIAGDMPKPKRFCGRAIWDRHAVDKAFDRLDDGGDTDEVIEFAP
ncbi:hypothetical protein XI04_03090 [Bradyrhizobium sp. CCBAU 11430]|uniref:hypothetical protein n=1 Tax=Bradyrhizobium sp. CCBAU 11430 TaxID=1630881 RepID=UPI002305C43E|nr:hypothetical protein [Bradyrhizobium sp. CCBAU 11430]MDA9512062.1 hypothetical protein [Bradyrhizobium sp. CCBAU 11430]